jgi:hypothetical protein
MGVLLMYRKLVLFSVTAAAALAQTGPSVQQIASWLTAAGLKADVSFLASDALLGRATPSPGLEIAGEYIAAQFRRAGLEPAGDDGYFQNAPFAVVTPNLDGFELSFEGGQTIKVDKSTVSIDEPAALDLKGAGVVAVTVGGPGALDSLTPEQVRGKVLLLTVPQGVPFGRSRAMSASYDRLQPAVVVLLRTVGNAQPPTGAGRVREVSGTARPIVTVSDAAVRSAIADLKVATGSVHIAAPAVSPARLRNVVGMLRGSDPQLKDTYVLVTAHYDHLGVRGTGPGDHIFNGANDDASGAASVIEIANALAALPERPKRSIVFLALFGEELGDLGSRYYGAHPLFPIAKTIADVNLEQLGRTDVDGGTSLGVLNVTGYDYSTVTEVILKAGEDTGIKVVKDEKNSDPFFARSDNQALADVGVPAHTLSVGYVFPDYHGAGDEWSKLDYDNLAKVDSTIALALYRMADSTDVPQWNAANPKTERYVKARK